METNTMPTMSTEDQANLASYKKMYDDAVAKGDSIEATLAHMNAEALRKKYGYSGGADGSQYIPAPSSSGNFTDTYVQNIYDQQTAAQEAALKSAYDQNVAANRAARDAIPGTYYEAKNSTAAQSAIGRQNFNERAAASGINSGAGSQAALAMDNALQSNLSDLDKQQAKDISASDLQLSQLTAKYQNDIASSIAEGKFQSAQAIYNKMLSDQAAARQQQQFDASLSLQKQQLSDAEKNNAASQALTAAQLSGNFSGMAAYNWDANTIAGANAAWKTQHGLTYTSRGSSGKGGGGEITPTFSDYNTATQYLRSKGLDSSALMTSTEWARHKNAGTDTGATYYSSYSDYLNAYVKYVLENS